MIICRSDQPYFPRYRNKNKNLFNCHGQLSVDLKFFSCLLIMGNLEQFSAKNIRYCCSLAHVPCLKSNPYIFHTCTDVLTLLWPVIVSLYRKSYFVQWPYQNNKDQFQVFCSFSTVKRTQIQVFSIPNSSFQYYIKRKTVCMLGLNFTDFAPSTWLSSSKYLFDTNPQKLILAKSNILLKS